jgi:hypothetical protein
MTKTEKAALGLKSLTPATRDFVLNFGPMLTKVVPIIGTNMTFKIKQLNARQYDEWLTEQDLPAYKNLGRALLIQKATINEDGSPMFQKEDLDAICNLPIDPVVALSSAILDLAHESKTYSGIEKNS